MANIRPPDDIQRRCSERARVNPKCYVYCSYIDEHWYIYARKSLLHARTLMEANHRVWVLYSPLTPPPIIAKGTDYHG